jgi:hypothetical protein
VAEQFEVGRCVCDMNWYSACIRLVWIIESDGGVAYQDSVCLFLASDWDSAKDKALRKGRSLERTYENVDGKMVRFALVRLVTLDLIEQIVDGVEVYSQPVDLNLADARPMTFDQTFTPESFEPTQSI